MKRILIIVFLFIFGMTAFSQDTSYFTRDYMRPDGTFAERLAVLEAVRSTGLSGIGEFYHEALKFLLLRFPDIRNNRQEQEAAERSAVILCQGLGAERYTAAAHDIWQTAVHFDVLARTANNPSAMQAALIALGQIDAQDFVPMIVQRLNDFNTQTFRGENLLRVQAAVIGCISALEALKDITGYRPVFNVAYIASYDLSTKQTAINALPNITDDPGEIISAIILDPGITPNIKLDAWNEMLKTRAPNSSKASVAAVALATGWHVSTSNRTHQANLSTMRKSAIDAIRQFGVADNSVYENLDRSYSTNFRSNTPDYDEIMVTLNALGAIKSDEAVDLLLKFLRELHTRRRSGPWTADRERRVFQWVVACIGFTGTNSPDVRLLLTTIEHTSDYTPHEQGLARNALAALGN